MTEVVCETGKFTIRDAILFHKFCIFNKEYFVFLAHVCLVVSVTNTFFFLLFSGFFSEKGNFRLIFCIAIYLFF